ncbi:MAG: hypothetical protein R3292_12600 [Alcanivorax sp.]|nr:hypothetical protein [Alcanivorax sp.]
MTGDSKLTLDQLVAGDVLVMVGDLRKSNPTRYLDELIMLLTDSDVCHGAIFVGKDPQAGYQLIDDALNGVGLRKIADDDNSQDPHFGRWYVRRMHQPTLEPVIQAARTYIGHSQYDKLWLVMLGVLLAIKDLAPHSELDKHILKLLKHVLYVVNQAFHKKDTDYFVCSQYVATAFKDAGPAFALEIESGQLSQVQSLLALDSRFAEIQPQLMDSATLNTTVEALQQANLDISVNQLDRYGDALLNAASQALLHALKNRDNSAFKAALIQQAGGYSSAFVTPACLKSGCKNLDPVGSITLGYGE